MPRTDAFGNIIPEPTINISDSWSFLNTPTIQDTKQARLQQRTAEKQAKLSMAKDTLLGMNDADTVVTSNLGTVRTSTPAAGYNYDAIESDHITRVLGRDGKYVEAPTADPLEEIQASRYKQRVQPDAVARVLGKPVNELTKQDYIDVANQQQIQALADMANGNNDWKAPLIHGVTSTNLTGKYVDEFGNKVDAPLNVPITSAAFGKGAYGRTVASLGSADGTNTTALEVNDPTQNAYTNIPSTKSSGQMTPEEYAKAVTAGIKDTPRSDSSWYSDLISGIVKGFTSGEMETANLVEDLGRAAVGAKGEGLLTNEAIDKASTEIANKFGYDEAAVRADMIKQKKLANEAFKDTYNPVEWDYDKILDLVGHSFSSFSMTGNSVGAMLAAVAGGGGVKLVAKGLSKAVLKKTTQEAIKKSAESRAIIEAAKAKLKDKAVSGADKFALKKEIVKNRKNLVATEAAFKAAKEMATPVAYGMAITEQDLAELRKNGEEITPQRIISATIANTLAIAVPELAVAKFQLGFAVDATGKVLKGDTLKKRAADAFKGAVTAYGTSVGFEVPQEMLQQGVQALNQKWGTKEYEGKSPLDIVKEEASNVLSAGVAAVGMSSHMMAPGVAIKTAKIPFGAKLNDKFKPKDKDTQVDIAEETIKANPSVSPEAIKKVSEKMVKVEGDSLATPTDADLKSTPIAPTEVNKEAHAAVAKQLHDNEGGVATVEEITPVSKEKEDALNGSLKQFDSVYEDALGRLTKPVADITKANTIREEAGLPIDEAKNKQYTEAVARGSKDFLGYIIKAKDEAIKQGAGPNQIAAMDAKIERLVPLATASNAKELHAILTDDKVTNSEKVMNILGSSAASLEDVESAIKLEGISENEKKLLKYKANALKNYKEVAGEKLLGGGSKPGALQWAAMLVEGIKDKKALENLNDFIGGQYDKVKAFQNEVSRWDRENKMPWTIDGHKDASKYSEDPKAMKDTKRLYRSEYLKDHKSADDAIVRYGNTTIRGIASIDALLDTLKTEHKSMQDLRELADSFGKPEDGFPAGKTEKITEADTTEKPSDTNTQVDSIKEEVVTETAKPKEVSPEAQKPTEKAKKEVKGKSTKEEPKRAPRVAKEAVAPTNGDGVILENLKPSDQKWIKAFRNKIAIYANITEASKRKFIKLKEESKKPYKKKINRRAEEVKAASEIPIGGSEDAKNTAVKTAMKKDITKSKYEKYTKEDIAEESEIFEREYARVVKKLEAFTTEKELAGTIKVFKDIDGLVGEDLLAALVEELVKLESNEVVVNPVIEKTTSVKIDTMKALTNKREVIINKLKTAPAGIRKIIMDNLSKCSGV